MKETSEENPQSGEAARVDRARKQAQYAALLPFIWTEFQLSLRLPESDWNRHVGYACYAALTAIAAMHSAEGLCDTVPPIGGVHPSQEITMFLMAFWDGGPPKKVERRFIWQDPDCFFPDSWDSIGPDARIDGELKRRRASYAALFPLAWDKYTNCAKPESKLHSRVIERIALVQGREESAQSTLDISGLPPAAALALLQALESALAKSGARK